jgi:hypothetical protein
MATKIDFVCDVILPPAPDPVLVDASELAELEALAG